MQHCQAPSDTTSFLVTDSVTCTGELESQLLPDDAAAAVHDDLMSPSAMVLLCRQLARLIPQIGFSGTNKAD